MTVIRTNRQTLFDTALQHCGDAQAVFEIANLNDVSLTDMDTLTLEVPPPYNKQVVFYYGSNGVQPACFWQTGNAIITFFGEQVTTIAGENIIAINH